MLGIYDGVYNAPPVLTGAYIVVFRTVRTLVERYDMLVESRTPGVLRGRRWVAAWMQQRKRLLDRLGRNMPQLRKKK